MVLRASCSPRTRRLPSSRSALPAFLPPGVSESARPSRTRAATTWTCHDDVRVVSSRRAQLQNCSRGLLFHHRARHWMIGGDLVSDTGLEDVLRHPDLPLDRQSSSRSCRCSVILPRVIAP